MAELTIAASGVRALFDVAVSRGASRTALAERSGIKLADLEDPDNRIAFSKYVALMRAGQEMCNDPALALHFGEEIDPAEMSFTHQIGARSMAEGMATMNRYARLTVEVGDEDTDRFSVVRSGGHLWLADNRRNANAFPELTESGFARIVTTMRRAIGDKPFIKAVHFTHQAPDYRAEYDRIFGVPVFFDSDKNAFLLEDGAMNFKPPVVSKYVTQLLTAHADELLEKLESSKSVRDRVERLLVSSLEKGDVTMEAIARNLGLSRQTLFRRLKAENVTFEKILDDLRHRLALHYLDGDKKSVSQTAYLVGFSDPAAFSRAFKRWTGSSPRAANKPRKV
jgi:AraC-type DNA-binding domain-containing proteins